MQKYISTLTNLMVAFSAMLVAATVQAQGTPLAVELLPLGKDLGISGGQTVTPAYEGWYTTEDGDIALSFGYYNRNGEEILDIPVGPGNRIIGTPDGEANQGQPTHFTTGRHYGVFAVIIPADHTGEVVWHLENQGKTFHIPANRNSDYVVDAIVGDANNNFPPQVRFEEGGEMGHGPAGITAGPLQARVGRPLTVDAWVSDDGKGSGMMAVFMANSERVPPVTADWFKHQGPGEVIFSETSARVPSEGAKTSTDVTFSEAGEYMLRIRLNEFTGASMAGHSQCCWSNGFVKVNVSD